jgi:hypothetical protein
MCNSDTDIPVGVNAIADSLGVILLPVGKRREVFKSVWKQYQFLPMLD